MRMRRNVLLWIVLLLCGPPSHAAREDLGFRHVTLDLPGPPAKLIPVELDGDGRTDLVVVVAYSEIEQIGEDRIEDLIQISRVIPTLFDRREARAYLATAEGDYVLAGPPLPLPASVLHLEAGPPGVGLIALTDDGLSRLTFGPALEGPPLRLEPLLDDPPILGGTGSFYPALELVHDLDGDGAGDVLLPSVGGPAVYLATEAGLGPGPTDRIELGTDEERRSGQTQRWYPWPEVRRINGDDLPDLLFEGRIQGGGRARLNVVLGQGGGRFGPLRAEPLDCHDRGTGVRIAVDDPTLFPWPQGLVAFRDLDGDGRAEAVTAIEQSRGGGWRKEMKDAKRPVSTYRFHRLNEDLFIDPEPYFETRVVGHGVDDDDFDLGDDDAPFRLEQFVDLDADGREDLIAITLEFSLWQAVKIMATKKIGIGVNFHIYAQQPDGSFREVPDVVLSEKLKFDLNDLKIGRFAQFAGDFDGDGLHDFVHLGQGRDVTLHAGRPGCRYPKKPDLAIRLEQEPPSLDLVRIEDLDGDGRSDLRITRPLPIDDPDVTAPARVDLYLSGGGS